MVRRRPAECLLQLPRPQPRERQRRQDRDHLRSRRRQVTKRHLPELHDTRLQIRQRPEIARHQEGRPRRHLHADVDRRRGRDAGLRPHRRHPLGGVRRLLRQVAAGTHHRCRRRCRHHRRRAVARRQAPAAESHRRRSARPGRLRHDQATSSSTSAPAATSTWSKGATCGCTIWCKTRPTPANRNGSSAEHPLFILYTSGSTGTPKGVQHSTGGYLLWADADHEVDLRHQADRRVLVHRRHRLGHRPHLHRLRPAGRGRHRSRVRRHSDLSRTPAASGRPSPSTRSASSTPRRPRSAR